MKPWHSFTGCFRCKAHQHNAMCVLLGCRVQVLFCTFTSMIGLMLATFSVVVKSGAVRLAGIE